MPRPRARWLTTAAALTLAAAPLALGVAAVGAPDAAEGAGAVHGRDRAPAAAAGEWQVRALAPGRYAVAWRSPAVLPLTSDRPTVRGPATYDIGPATVDPDGRTVRAVVGAPQRPTPAELDVVLSGDRLDAAGDDRVRRTAPAASAPLDLAGTVTLPEDPATPGPHAVVTSDYTLAPLKVVGLREPVEMVGHVVEPDPAAATGPRPLVLFLHGRHGVCYQPGKADAWSDTWPCRTPFQEIPSHLGYDYLQRVLASQGYATVSIRVNGINAQDGDLADGGAGARAQVVQAHLDHWVGLAAGHRIDLGRVVLVGHSRGGEGVARASVRIPLTAPYRVVGQILLAPTDFGSQSSPYVPTVAVLPFCDGDVSDLQGQRFVDNGRDLSADDTALRSSVLVMGADHNFFNTEWTPGLAAAPASDDWSGPKRQPCGRRDPQRLSAAEQRAVGTAYVAGAVHLFAAGDGRVLPLFDGSRARVASQGRAQTLSHALGGGRALRTPGATASLSLPGGALTRLCRGDGAAARLGSCAHDVSEVAAAPHWPATGERVPTRTFFEMSWSSAGQSGGLLLAQPLDLTGRRLELRAIVDPRMPAAVQVRLTDTAGASATLTPVGGGGLATLGGSVEVRKLWAQALVVDPAGAAIDLSHVARVDLVGRSGSGHVWVADLAAAGGALVDVPQRRLATVSLGSTTIDEGAGGRHVVRLPFHVTGAITAPAQLVVVTAGEARGQLQRFTVDLAPGQTDGWVPVEYDADHRADHRRLTTQVAAWATRNVATDVWSGRVTIRDDDPRPRVRVRTLAPRVIEGQAARWRVRLDRPADYEVPVGGLVVRSTRPALRVDDVDPDWIEEQAGSVPAALPLWRAHVVTFASLRPGDRVLDIVVPIRRDGIVEPPESLRLRIDVDGHRFKRTVTVVDAR